jgi:hypothetical protein
MQPNARVVVLTLGKVSPAQLMKRALLLARLPRGARILGVNALPNILELMGMPSGGGPPGFSVLLPPVTPEEPKYPLTNVLIAGYPPGAMVAAIRPASILGAHIGACTSAGLLLNYFELVMSNDTFQFTEPGELIKMLAELNLTVLPLEEYKVPPELEQALMSQAVKG